VEGLEGDALGLAMESFSPDPKRPGPPPMPLGAAPVLTATGAAASLWTLAGTTEPPPGDVFCPFGGEARQARDAAMRALPDSVPLLWRSLRDADLRGRKLSLVATHVYGNTPVLEHTIEGLSCGLSLYLMMVSRVFRKPLPEDVAASARIDPLGRLAGVGRLPEKIELLVEWAPRIRRLLVSSEQVSEARSAARGRLEIVGLESAHDIVDVVWRGRDVLPTWLVQEGRTAAQRRDLLAQFFRLSVSGREALPDWNPLHRAACVALDAWKDELSEEELRPLLFARAVSGRFEGEAKAGVELPPVAWIDELPFELRLAVVAQFVQHCADLGIPSVKEARALYEKHAAQRKDAHSLHFAIQGAYGRLLAVTGSPEEAFELQEEAARAMVARFDYAAASSPVAELFRLAGALGRAEDFERVDELWSEVYTLGELPEASWQVDLARWRAGLALGKLEGPDLTADIASLASSRSGAPVHLRCSALRLLARLQRSGRCSSDKIVDGAARLEHLSRTADPDDRDDAEVYSTLVELDCAVEREDRDAAAAAIEILHDRKPGRMGHLLGSAEAEGAEPARYVARFWPY